MSAIGNERSGNTRLGARQAAGAAGGALAGRYPNPGLGIPACTGGGFTDDFTGNIVKTGPISLGWVEADIAGGLTLAGYADTAAEIGILYATTAGAGGDGGVIYQPSGAITGGLPVGFRFQTKVRLDTTLQIVACSGFSSATGALPIVAAAASFVGVRAIAAGAGVNWLFVAKDGAGGANETTLDSGVAAGTTWRIFEMRVTAAAQIDCYLVDCSDTLVGPQYTSIGSLTSNIPTAANLYAALGLGASAAAVKGLLVDWHGWGGTIVR